VLTFLFPLTENAAISLLDAATNDLPQLIIRLDLEATPVPRHDADERVFTILDVTFRSWQSYEIPHDP